MNSYLSQRTLCRAALVFLSCAGFSCIVLGASAPWPAAEVGYAVNSFSTTSFDASNVDLNDSKARGFQWYMWNLFSRTAKPDSVVFNKDGTVTLLGDDSGASGSLVTSVAYRGTNTFVGANFGGGAYIEAELKFDPHSVATAKVKPWPAFWSLSLEGNITANTNQWKGQPAGYVHQIEADFFEAIRDPVSANSYGGSMHDWYGIYNKTCIRGLCQAGMPYSTGMRRVPLPTDFTQFHKYGFLWKTATKEQDGYAKFYFDGVQVGPTQEWQLYKDQPPPPVDQRWAFGILDTQHLFLILGTGQTQPMTVKSVNVWQKSESANLLN